MFLISDISIRKPLMRLVTVATHSDGYFPWLIQSCERHNADLEILGWGQKWQGFAWRLTLMIDYLKSLDQNEIVCFIDAYDVVLLKPLSKIEERFIKIHKETKCKMVVAHEDHDSMIHYLGANFTFGTCKGQNVNAGTYVGFANDLIETLEQIYKLNPQFNSDDQELLVKYCKAFPQKIHIDVDKTLFYTFIDVFGFSTKKLLQDISVMDSCVLHAPVTTSITKELKALGYTFTKEQDENIKKFHRKTLMSKIMYYAYLVRYILLIIVIVALITIITIRITKYFMHC